MENIDDQNAMTVYYQMTIPLQKFLPMRYFMHNSTVQN